MSSWGPFTQNAFFSSSVLVLFFYINILDGLVGHCACVLHLLPGLAHEHLVLRCSVQVKRISTFTCSATHQSPSQNSGPIRRPQRRGKSGKLLFTVASWQLFCLAAAWRRRSALRFSFFFTIPEHCVSHFSCKDAFCMNNPLLTVWVSSVEHKRRYFEECWWPKQLMVAIDFHSILFHTMEYACNGSQNSQFGSYYCFRVTDQIIFRISKKRDICNFAFHLLLKEHFKGPCTWVRNFRMLFFVFVILS